ncbi:MAG: transposase [Alphaproteobacteria bacterium]|nr:transposase [Alphaproteobacteria bacterium]
MEKVPHPARLQASVQAGKLVEVPAVRSRQICPVCGTIDPARLRQAAFVCVGCGQRARADANAAINTLWRADCALKPWGVCRAAQ